MKTVAELPAGVEFRPLPGLPRYVVSACGLIFSRDAHGHGWRPVRGSGSGRVVILTDPDGKRVASTVGMVVASVWVGPRPPDTFVKFRDGNRSNLRAGNLYWAPPR